MRRITICAVLLGLAWTFTATAGTAPRAAGFKPYQTHPGSSVNPPDGSATTMRFVGEIMQQKGKYVLQESMGKTIFQLDDQAKARAFDGQKVIVTGTLNAATDTIHISEIKPVSA